MKRVPMLATLLLVLATLLLAGCIPAGLIDQIVRPVPAAAPERREICVIENPAVATKDNFLAAYERALTERGFTVRKLTSGSPVSACPLTSSYTANFRWDMALYMAYANLKIFRNGQLVGEAMYDAMLAGLTSKKWISAEEKVRELTKELFPG